MTDVIILEFLDDHDLELSPKPLYRNLTRHGHDIGYSTIRGRVRELKARGVLDKDNDGYYEITERGSAFLAGELNATELENNP
ncbi:winged-helix domain-containing protein [Halorubrum sp. AS12]|uniref:winged-helix domain-containing protein n=1 Tax=Halorubrum sp. AS12 TaxID=3409687 RepID=UPI003DA75E9B